MNIIEQRLTNSIKTKSKNLLKKHLFLFYYRNNLMTTDLYKAYIIKGINFP